MAKRHDDLMQNTAKVDAYSALIINFALDILN